MSAAVPAAAAAPADHDAAGESSRHESSPNGRKRKRRKGVTKRLRTELAQLMVNSCTGIVAFPGSNIMSWTGKIDGPPKTAYEDLTFSVSIKFPLEYPYSPPSVKFITPCYHPNVDMHGNICLDILSDKWSAAYTTSTILMSIQSLLAQPNNSDPLNAQAAETWENQALFRHAVRAHALAQQQQQEEGRGASSQ